MKKVILIMMTFGPPEELTCEELTLVEARRKNEYSVFLLISFLAPLSQM